MAERVGLVRYPGEVHAWVLSLPGCIAGAHSRQGLDEPLRLATAEYRSWLAEHGERVPGATPPDWDIVEEIDGAAFADTGGEFCFEDDRRPLKLSELDFGLRLLALARRDQLATTQHLAREVLDWAPPREAFDRFDAWAPNVRTIRDVARHILELEVYYRCGLQDGPSTGIFEAVGSPEEELRTTIRCLREADPARSYWPTRPGRTTAEEWTLRKVLRRLISHERIHTAEIWQRRAWTLLGTPSLATSPHPTRRSAYPTL